MHIVNMMLSKGSGGIEQAFVDYCDGLSRRGHRVTPITHPNAQVNATLTFMGMRPMHISNMGEWDPFARLALRRTIKKLKADVVIAHTGRAFALAQFGTHHLCPLVGVTHNYYKRIKRFARADSVFSITHDLISHVMQYGIEEDRVYHIPNMVRCEALPKRTTQNDTPVIGTMGRFVTKKGFEIYIDALQILQRKGFIFRAVLGGSGSGERTLKKRAKLAGLSDILEFTGWVENKQAFYEGLDIFCLPSLHEPFGIVLLEAFTYGTPVVTTYTEGPRDIVTANFDALIAEPGSASELADQLARLLEDAELRSTLAANAFVKARTTYAMQSVSERIEIALEKTILRWKKENNL